MSKFNVSYSGALVPTRTWNPSVGCIGTCSFDCETTRIEKGSVPHFILGSAFNGKHVYLIPDKALKQFFEKNENVRMYMANAAFDLHVAQALGAIDGTKVIESGGVIDILLLSHLLSLAETGMLSPARSLAALSKAVLNFELNKETEDENGDLLRTSFENYRRHDGSIDYQSITFKHLEYAALDAICTFEIGERIFSKTQAVSEKLLVDVESLLSHDVQLKAAFALAEVERKGLGFDLSSRDDARSHLLEVVSGHLEELDMLGWRPGEGSGTQLQAKLREICANSGSTLPSTQSGKISSKAEHLQDFRGIPFVDCYLGYQENKKILDFLEGKESRIHSRFTTLVSTGRTASADPNIQQLPRNPVVRSLVVPAPGHVFLDVDYSQIELRVLAQIALDQFGYSEMAELINSGVDLHRYFAGKLVGKDPDKVTEEERNKAKACNFGFPGGLGIEAFIKYARKSYNINLTVDEAKSLKQLWLETFPEIEEYLQGNEIEKLAESELLYFGELSSSNSRSDLALAWTFWGIISGKKENKAGVPYSEQDIEWAFGILDKLNFPHKSKCLGQIRRRNGSKDLWRNVSRVLNTVKVPSGRVRANATYTQSKNNVFQGIAADGAKEALYELVKAGYRVVNFIHDEFLIEVPLTSDREVVEASVSRIATSSMKKHCPDVQIEVNCKWMSSWSKDDVHLLSRN